MAATTPASARMPKPASRRRTRRIRERLGAADEMVYQTASVPVIVRQTGIAHRGNTPMSQSKNAVQTLCRTLLLRDGAGLTDGQLLECYVHGRDEAAFAALVRRHGPMV